MTCTSGGSCACVGSGLLLQDRQVHGGSGAEAVQAVSAGQGAEREAVLVFAMAISSGVHAECSILWWQE